MRTLPIGQSPKTPPDINESSYYADDSVTEEEGTSGSQTDNTDTHSSAEALPIQENAAVLTIITQKDNPTAFIWNYSRNQLDAQDPPSVPRQSPVSRPSTQNDPELEPGEIYEEATPRAILTPTQIQSFTAELNAEMEEEDMQIDTPTPRKPNFMLNPLAPLFTPTNANHSINGTLSSPPQLHDIHAGFGAFDFEPFRVPTPNALGLFPDEDAFPRPSGF